MRRIWMAALVGIACLASGAAMAGQGRGGKASAVRNPVPASVESITEGRQLYLKQCRHCHGTRGLGDGPLAPRAIRPPNLTDDTWDHGSTDGEIFAVIANGLGPDSVMKGATPALNDAQIWNIVNFLRALNPPAGAR